MSTPLRYVMLGNGEVAVRHLHRAVLSSSTPELLVMNAVAKQQCGSELRRLAREGGVPVVEWGDAAIRRMMELAVAEPDIWILSIYFGHILNEPLLDCYNRRAVNLHPAMLPWNRGATTNVWPIIDGSPAGVTLHAMIPAVDAGPILLQRQVPVHAYDTAGSLYMRLIDAADALLADSWPDKVLEQWPGCTPDEEGSNHTLAEFRALREIELTDSGEGRRVFDLLRARSFPGHQGLRIRIGSDVVEAYVQLKPVDDERGS